MDIFAFHIESTNRILFYKNFYTQVRKFCFEMVDDIKKVLSKALAKENDLLRQSTKKIKQNGANFDENNETSIVYNTKFLSNPNEFGTHLFTSYIDNLPGKGKQSGEEEQMEDINDDLSDFEVEED